MAVHLPTSPGYPAVLRDDPGAPAVLFSRGTPRCARRSATGGHRRDPVGDRLRPPGRIRAGARPGRGRSRRGIGAGSGYRRSRPRRGPTGRPGRYGPACGRGGHRSGRRLPGKQRVVVARGRRARCGLHGVGPGHHPPDPGSSRPATGSSLPCPTWWSSSSASSKGGALYTAEAAARRSIPVCAVPGSVRSPASAGTNGLLVDGCAPVRDVDDILTAVALARCGKEAPIRPHSRRLWWRPRDRSAPQNEARPDRPAPTPSVPGRPAAGSEGRASPDRPVRPRVACSSPSGRRAG